MKKLLAVIGFPEFEQFKEKIEQTLKNELSGELKPDEHLDLILYEIYKVTPETFKMPVQINESEMRIFFSKMAQGVHPVRSGPTLFSYKELKNFYKNKIGEQRFGKDWTLKALKDKTEDLSTGVYLVCGLTEEEVTRAKQLFKDEFLVVQVIPELPKPKRGEERKKAEVLKETDITVTYKKTEDGIKREISKLLQKIKIKQKETNVSNKPKFRIAQRQFRPWNA